MPSVNVFSEEFAQAVAAAGLRARQKALASGHSVVFVDGSGRYVEELPDGRKLHVCLHAGVERKSHLQRVGELLTNAG